MEIKLEEKYLLLDPFLDNHPEIGLIYLFGSRASDQAGPLSDYDFALWVESMQDLMAYRLGLVHELAVLMGEPNIDLVILNEAPVELAYHIIAAGKLLYQRDISTRVEYEANVLSLYGDYLPVLRAQRADILEGGENDSRVQRYRTALGRIGRTVGAP